MLFQFLLLMSSHRMEIIQYWFFLFNIQNHDQFHLIYSWSCLNQGELNHRSLLDLKISFDIVHYQSTLQENYPFLQLNLLKDIYYQLNNWKANHSHSYFMLEFKIIHLNFLIWNYLKILKLMCLIVEKIRLKEQIMSIISHEDHFSLNPYMNCFNQWLVKREFQSKKYPQKHFILS